MKQFTMEKAFYTNEFCEWPDEITVLLSDELQGQISRATSIIKNNDYIRMIDINVPHDFLPNNEWQNGAAAIDIDKIIVSSDGFYYYVQCKWDAGLQAEYCISGSNGDPL